MLLIADPTGPTGIAGVMGGAKSEVSPKTTTILLEAANFKGGNVRHTSTVLGLRTDASSRFEKGLDPELALAGSNRAVQLMVELAGGVVNPGVVDIYPQPAQPRTLEFSTDEVEWLTSMKVTQDEIITALRALDFTVVPDEQGEKVLVTIPSYRSDIEEGADLVEEVARLIGYDRIPSTIPIGPLPALTVDTWFEREQEIRDLLVGSGLNEIVTYTLTSRARMANLLAYTHEDAALALLQTPGRSDVQAAAITNNAATAVATFDPATIPAVALVNPLSPSLEVMRLTLMSNLLEMVQSNSKHNNAGLRFFEIGRRYLPMEDKLALPDERRSVGIALYGPAAISWVPDLSRPADFYDLKGVLETLLEGLKIRHYRFTPTQHPTFHPGRCAMLELPYTNDAGEEIYSPVGVLGEVHPLVQQRYDLSHRTYLCELDLEQLYAAVPARVVYQPISRHQELTRDLALVVDQHIVSQDIQDDIIRHGGELLRNVTLFDVYTGEPIPAGKKNLTYSLVYQSQDRTLTDGEVNALQDHIMKILHEDFGAVLR